jgi:hypothetical protein
VTSHIVDAKELAAALNVSELDLQHIAHNCRLPFSIFNRVRIFLSPPRPCAVEGGNLSLRPTTVVKFDF